MNADIIRADLDHLPPYSGRRSEFSGNFYAVFIEKNSFKKLPKSCYLRIFNKRIIPISISQA